MKARPVLVYLPLLAVAVSAMLPLLFMISTSLKSFPETLSSDQAFWPSAAHWENYAQVFREFPLLRYLGNTVTITVGRVAGTVFSCALVAWGFARYPGRWNTVLFAILLGTLMLPTQITAVPIFTMFLELGFYNTYFPLIFPSWLGCNAFFVFLLRQFFAAIPEDLINAARIDGAGELRIFWEIGLPLCKPILWTVAIFTFIHSWNDYFTPLVYLNNEELYPVSLGLTQFRQATQEAAFGTQWNLLMAASFITILPVALVFFFAQRSFVQSLMSGSLKQ